MEGMHRGRDESIGRMGLLYFGLCCNDEEEKGFASVTEKRESKIWLMTKCDSWRPASGGSNTFPDRRHSGIINAGTLWVSKFNLHMYSSSHPPLLVRPAVGKRKMSTGDRA